ncbi:hypothetical protein OLEAN_C08710 [Oleispira antarctica RB-8]|uniref:Uncharacterized protein n=1 Tax=Oleispira antarctica RB-8 TaxID=698738 RepID=R4YKQ5_OLEAN|nr:hypothetical protein OLEAN_C08710 [Oleispira antarctica RB-8]
MKTMNDFLAMLDEQKSLICIRRKQFDVWIESSVIVPGSNKETEDGFHYMDFEYRLCCMIERLPAAQGGLLCLLVHQFVNGLDRHELETVSVDISDNDGKTVDAEINFGVRDPFYLVPVENSPIVIDGVKMGFGEGGLDVAEVVTLNALS